jgi:alkylation response protein AidB-like acyl-CoA dehydrogenase
MLAAELENEEDDRLSQGRRTSRRRSSTVILELTDEQAMFQHVARGFLRTRSSIADVRSLYAHPVGYHPAFWRDCAKLGWSGLLIPPKYGGSLSGTSILDVVIVAEEFGRLVTPGPLIPVSVVADAVARSGSSRQKLDVLPGLASGDLVATWCRSDNEGRWVDPRNPVRAIADGENYVLSGTAGFVESASEADVFLVSAVAEERPIQFLVRSETPGLSVQRRTSLDFVRRVGDVSFDRVLVGGDAVLGGYQHARRDIDAQLNLAAVIECAETMGAFERAFEFTVDYALQRVAFGKVIGSYQAIKHRLADIKTAIEAGHAAVAAAARAVQDSGVEAAELASVAKSYVTQQAVAGMQDCVQVHGGIGVTWEHDLHLYLRRALTSKAMYGSPAEHRDRLCSLAW